MIGKFQDFFVDLAQVFKKHQVTSSFGSRLPVSFTEGNTVVGQYRIIEAWIDREGEAVIRVKSDASPDLNLEYDIYSDGRVG